MPKIDVWDRLPKTIRDHLIQRLQDRQITLTDLNQLRIWVEGTPEVPDGEWYKDFGTFKLCGEGSCPKTFLTSGQSAKGTKI